MCYTGKCKYETYAGDCEFFHTKDIPDDAPCNYNNKYEIESFDIKQIPIEDLEKTDW
jgi:hypothetical protein